MKSNSKINKEFITQGAEQTSEAELDKALENETKIEDKIANSGIFRKYAELSKLMFQMLNDYRKGNYNKVPWFTVATVVFILLYVLNPLDLVPDFIPIVGYVDDLSVLALGINFIQTDLHNYLNWKSKHPQHEFDEKEEDYDYEY